MNTDYRAFARWPSYLSLAWNDLSTKVTSSLYERIVTELHYDLVDQVFSLPNNNYNSSKYLISEAQKDAELEEVLSVVRLFQWLLPGLVINIAYMRKQLI